MSGIDGPRRPPVGAAAAEALVILVHGYGADGNDLIDLASYWAEDLPAVAFVSPHAPDPCEMAPFGRQWFSLVDRSPAAMLAGVRGAAKILNDFIDAELARQNLTADKLALVGFSQGTMMSLFVGPRRERQIAGIVGYSGRLIAPDLLPRETKTKPPVTLLHGAADEIVPPQSLDMAVAGLATAGINADHEMRAGLGHSIDERGLAVGGAFLKRVLGFTE